MPSRMNAPLEESFIRLAGARAERTLLFYRQIFTLPINYLGLCRNSQPLSEFILLLISIFPFHRLKPFNILFM